MRRFTLGEMAVASVLAASAMSAATCIIPGGAARSHAEWVNNRTPEAEQAMREASRWPLREHAKMAAELSVAFMLMLGCINLFLPSASGAGEDSVG